MIKASVLSIILATSLLYLSSCKEKQLEPVDENQFPNNIYWGSAQALVNGRTNISSSSAEITDGLIDLTIKFEVLPGYLRHRVSAFRVPQDTGKYYLSDFVPFWEDQSENVRFGWFSGDAVVATYKQWIDSTFILSVEQLDIQTGDISGTYSGIFVKKYPLEHLSGPDTVRIEQGIFKTRITKP